MAYMSRGEGPYPCDKGEYCGNYLVGSDPLLSIGESPEEALRHRKEYLARMRFGRPHSCQAGSSKEMQERGYVGLYLKEDCNLMDWETRVPTPDDLKEPEEEN